MTDISLEELAALAALALAGTFTPGPNNALLSASGARFGLRATLPHARGVALGFPLMVFAVALGLGQVFQASELLREALRWGGAALMAWIAWKIATAPAPGQPTRQDGTGGAARPWSFLQAAAFQWVNPKAWVMCIGIAAPFANGEHPVRDAAIAAGIFVLSGILSTHSWAAFGAAMGRFLGHGLRYRVFNLVMAGLIVLGVAALISGDLSTPTPSPSPALGD